MAKTYEREFRPRAFELAVLVFNLYPRLAAAGPAHEFIAKQLLKSATSIGSQLEEGHAPSSRRDKAEKHSIGLREAREANYWARIGATDARWAKELKPIIAETHEFVAMLTVSVQKLRRPQVPDVVVGLGLVFFFVFLLLSYLLPASNLTSDF